MILKNPTRNLQIPQTGAKKRTAIESDQIKLFMDYVKTSPQYSYAYPEFIFLFNTGVRIGELAGLTWDNVDFKIICLPLIRRSTVTGKRLRFYYGVGFSEEQNISQNDSDE